MEGGKARIPCHGGGVPIRFKMLEKSQEGPACDVLNREVDDVVTAVGRGK